MATQNSKITRKKAATTLQRPDFDAHDARKRLERAKEREQLELEWLPGSHQQYRDHMIRTFKPLLRNMRVGFLAEGVGGYRMAPESLDEFDDAVENLIAAVSGARTFFNPRAALEAIAEIRGRTAKEDAGLQHFIQCTVGRTAKHRT